MFNFFKKKTQPVNETRNNFDVELTASILAYEIARSDGDISESELSLLYDEIKKISAKVGKKEDKILEIIEEYSKNSVSFYEFVNDINKELKSLTITSNDKIPDKSKVKELINNLKKINLKLWDIEENKRLAEKNQKFDEEFINLSRDVYKTNDERAKIKLKINEILGSNIKEVKSHY